MWGSIKWTGNDSTRKKREKGAEKKSKEIIV